jgi:hypothetical protein
MSRNAQLLARGLAALILAGAAIHAASAQTRPARPAPLRQGFNLPPPGETRFVPNEVMLDIPPNVTTQSLDAIAVRHRMTRLETQSFRLTGSRR